MDDERIAYHEAGHAVAAVWLGGEVVHVTLEPDRDDGPSRDGELLVRWHHRGLSPRDLLAREVAVALAGPAAEMLYLGERPHPLTVREWAEDWRIVWMLAAEWVADPALRMQWIEASLRDLCGLFDQAACWQAVAETADELSAHETLCGEQVEAIVRRWMG
ncbi:hypothetical protein [Candidatus Laterigemmans baculatus]|uniref:hypothetical protein n=1 Tax=Candidatus Laterigemmans baculatus TaxID=2770505 RepID=UPI0013DC2900|nr:hypothetical protein [Candidatus Laterigemmans baculatus]